MNVNILEPLYLILFYDLSIISDHDHKYNESSNIFVPEMLIIIVICGLISLVTLKQQEFWVINLQC